jgi:hypothetical protein
MVAAGDASEPGQSVCAGSVLVRRETQDAGCIATFMRVPRLAPGATFLRPLRGLHLHSATHSLFRFEDEALQVLGLGQVEDHGMIGGGAPALEQAHAAISVGGS